MLRTAIAYLILFPLVICLSNGGFSQGANGDIPTYTVQQIQDAIDKTGNPTFIQWGIAYLNSSKRPFDSLDNELYYSIRACLLKPASQSIVLSALSIYSITEFDFDLSILLSDSTYGHDQRRDGLLMAACLKCGALFCDERIRILLRNEFDRPDRRSIILQYWQYLAKRRGLDDIHYLFWCIWNTDTWYKVYEQNAEFRAFANDLLNNYWQTPDYPVLLNKIDAGYYDSLYRGPDSRFHELWRESIFAQLKVQGTGVAFATAVNLSLKPDSLALAKNIYKKFKPSVLTMPWTLPASGLKWVNFIYPGYRFRLTDLPQYLGNDKFSQLVKYLTFQDQVKLPTEDEKAIVFKNYLQIINKICVDIHNNYGYDSSIKFTCDENSVKIALQGCHPLYLQSGCFDLPVIYHLVRKAIYSALLKSSIYQTQLFQDEIENTARFITGKDAENRSLLLHHYYNNCQVSNTAWKIENAYDSALQFSSQCAILSSSTDLSVVLTRPDSIKIVNNQLIQSILTDPSLQLNVVERKLDFSTHVYKEVLQNITDKSRKKYTYYGLIPLSIMQLLSHNKQALDATGISLSLREIHTSNAVFPVIIDDMIDILRQNPTTALQYLCIPNSTWAGYRNTTDIIAAETNRTDFTSWKTFEDRDLDYIPSISALPATKRPANTLNVIGKTLKEAGDSLAVVGNRLLGQHFQKYTSATSFVAPSDSVYKLIKKDVFARTSQCVVALAERYFYTQARVQINTLADNKPNGIYNIGGLLGTTPNQNKVNLVKTYDDKMNKALAQLAGAEEWDLLDEVNIPDNKIEVVELLQLVLSPDLQEMLTVYALRFQNGHSKLLSLLTNQDLSPELQLILQKYPGFLDHYHLDMSAILPNSGPELVYLANQAISETYGSPNALKVLNAIDEVQEANRHAFASGRLIPMKTRDDIWANLELSLIHQVVDSVIYLPMGIGHTNGSTKDLLDKVNQFNVAVVDSINTWMMPSLIQFKAAIDKERDQQQNWTVFIGFGSDLTNSGSLFFSFSTQAFGFNFTMATGAMTIAPTLAYGTNIIGVPTGLVIIPNRKQ